MKSEGRGMLCESVINKSKEFLGREISQKELRLYPYLDYVWKNGGVIDYSKVSYEEEDIISEMVNKGYMRIEEGERRKNKLYPTREFYDYVQDILADTYVRFVEDIKEK